MARGAFAHAEKMDPLDFESLTDPLIESYALDDDISAENALRPIQSLQFSTQVLVAIFQPFRLRSSLAAICVYSRGMESFDPVVQEMDAHYMGEALREARKAHAAEEVPVGAVIVLDSRIIGRAHNQVELLRDATAHAEMLALTQAQAALENQRLLECTLYVTKEPCPMCAGAIIHTRIGRVVFGVSDPKAGALGGAFDLQSVKGLNHRCVISKGIREEESLMLLQTFFRSRRGDNVKNNLPE